MEVILNLTGQIHKINFFELSSDKIVTFFLCNLYEVITFLITTLLAMEKQCCTGTVQENRKSKYPLLHLDSQKEKRKEGILTIRTIGTKVFSLFIRPYDISAAAMAICCSPLEPINRVKH